MLGPAGDGGSVDVPAEGTQAAPHGPARVTEQRRTPGKTLGNALMVVGAGLTLVVIPLVIGAIVLFSIMFAIGFSEDPAETSAGAVPILLGALAVILTIEGLLLWALWRGLHGRRGALATLMVIGLLVAVFALRQYQVWQSGIEDDADVQFLLAHIAVVLSGAVLFLGALIRWLSRGVHAHA